MTNKYFVCVVSAVLVIIALEDIWLLVDSYVDGKYMIEEPYGVGAAEVYYMRVDCLSVAMFINLGIAILIFMLLLIKRKKLT